MMKRLSMVLAFLFSVAFSEAQDVPSSPLVGAQTVQMQLDCVNMSASAREYADKHGLCDGDFATFGSDTVTPNGTAVGNCGTTSISIQPLGSGFVTFFVGVNSSLGPMTAVFWTIPFTNLRTNQSGSVGGQQFGLSTTYSANTSAIFTSTGTIQAGLFGSVTLWWGGTCTFNGAVAFAQAF